MGMHFQRCGGAFSESSLPFSGVISVGFKKKIFSTRFEYHSVPASEVIAKHHRNDIRASTTTAMVSGGAFLCMRLIIGG
jgi:hypothetical protein